MSRRSTLSPLAGAALAAVLLLAAGRPAAAQDTTAGFDHAKHAKTFVSCKTCHVGAFETGAPMFPEASKCAACHDGDVEKKVTWEPRVGPRVTNLLFTHDKHRAELTKKTRPDSVLACVTCHEREAAPWMTVRRAVVTNCFSCHKLPAEHLAIPDSACAKCHMPLWEARTLPESRIATFKAPPTHDDPDFRTGKHGDYAKPAALKGTSYRIAQSCPTCHARDYCISCHVNAPDEPAIRALQPDPRSLAVKIDTSRPAPNSHSEATFLKTHGTRTTMAAFRQECSVCHSQQSCEACHIVPPRKVMDIPSEGPGRARGVVARRKRPESHDSNFVDAHGRQAAAKPQYCATCHSREQCLECHRPNPAAVAGYHPADFLQRHPLAAYSREISCADCHNTGQFCKSCHAQAGLRTTSVLGTKQKYHDANGSFVAGHGQAARQSLESCVSCHTERDCLTCHSAVGGRRFNPHGPGWDAERMRSKNPQMCIACHGFAIPGTK